MLWDNCNNDGDLDLEFNYALLNIDGLSDLQVLEGGINLTDNDFIQNVDSLSNLTSINGEFE